MKTRFLATLLASLLVAAAAAATQRIDPDLRGVWKLNVAKSAFGPWPKPKMGQVSWTEHGWVFALVTAESAAVRNATRWLHIGTER